MLKAFDEQKKIRTTAFLDIKKVFDSAWHPAIFSVLSNLRWLTHFFKIIYSLLSNRWQLLQFVTLLCLSQASRQPLKCCAFSLSLQHLSWQSSQTTFFLPSPYHCLRRWCYYCCCTQKPHSGCSQSSKRLWLCFGTWLVDRKFTLNALKTVLVLFSSKHRPLSDLTGSYCDCQRSPDSLLIEGDFSWTNPFSLCCARLHCIICDCTWKRRHFFYGGWYKLESSFFVKRFARKLLIINGTWYAWWTYPGLR